MSASCQERYQDEINRFETLLYTSLALTVVNLFVSTVFIVRSSWTRHCMAQYFGITGSIKIGLAVALFATIPVCPPGCSCTGGHVNPLVGVIPLVIGVRWVTLGYKYHQLGQPQAQQQQSTAAATAVDPNDDNGAKSQPDDPDKNTKEESEIDRSIV